MSGSDRRAAQSKGLICALWVPLLFAQTIVWGQSDAPLPDFSPIPLSEGQTLRATHSVDEPIAYVFDAAEGQTYLIQVDQEGLDFIVTVRAPDYATRSFDSPLFRDEEELVLVEDAVGGHYWITVYSEEPTGAVGAHTITVSDVSTSASDSRYVAAWRFMSEGAAAHADGTRERAQDALQYYEDAAESWWELGETRRRAQSLYSAAMLRYWCLDDWVGATEQAAEVAKIY